MNVAKCTGALPNKQATVFYIQLSGNLPYPKCTVTILQGKK